MKRNISICLILLCCIYQQYCSAQYNKIFDFDYTYTGVYPYYCALISDGTYLYGTTSTGGEYSGGTVFKIKRDGSGYTTLYDFDDTTGTGPRSSLLLLEGYLYGTANSGGNENSDGTIFKIRTDGSDFTIVKYFERDITGSKPESSLYYEGTYLYGTCVQGGPGSGGTLYKLKPDGSDFSTIRNFAIGAEGYSPHAHVISDGTYLYGMTKGGGSGGLGTVYKIKPEGAGYSDIYNFNDDSGSWGMGGLVYDGSAWLYGMTNNGGAENLGTVFKVRTDGTGYETLLDFISDNGAQPLGSLILVDNILYGLTELGSPDEDIYGTMFSIETDGSNFNILVDFDGDNGAYPYGTLLYEDGAFFGMTMDGGANNSGVIFQYGDVVEAVQQFSVSSFDIFPNPAEEFITFTLPQLTEEKIQLELINTMGEIVLSEILQPSDREINIADISAGIYIVKAQQEKQIFTSKLIIQ